MAKEIRRVIPCSNSVIIVIGDKAITVPLEEHFRTSFPRITTTTEKNNSTLKGFGRPLYRR